MNIKDGRTLLRIGLMVLGIVALLAVTVSVLGWPFAQAPARVVRVGVYENPPKIYTDPEGRPAGLFIEVLQAIAEREHWSLEFRTCQWDKCLEQLRDGRIDLMPDTASTAARRRDFSFHTVPVAYGWTQIFAHKGQRIATLDDLRGLRVALLRRGVQQAYFAHLMQGAGIPYVAVPESSPAATFEAVRSGSADVVLSNNFFAARHAHEYALVETPIVLQAVSLYFATARGHNRDLMAAIDLYLGKWRDDRGSVYFSALHRSMMPPPEAVVPQWLEQLLLLAVSIIGLFLVVSLLLRWQVRQRTAELTRTTRRLQDVLRKSPVVLYMVREHAGRFVIEWVSPNIGDLFGFSPGEAMQEGWWYRQLHPADAEGVVAALDVLPADAGFVHEYRMLDARGQIRYIRDELRIEPTAEGSGRLIAGSWSDLTEAREQAERVDFLTHHDALTGLINRYQLMHRLGRSIARAGRSQQRLAVISIDLDRFKQVNETLGHAAGDDYLRAVSRAMDQVLGRDDTLARISGDGFVAVIEGITASQRAPQLARRLSAAIAAPVEVAGQEVIVTASMGISLYPSDGEDAETLLRNAELALYEGKSRGRNTVRRFDPSLSAGVAERFTMEHALRMAIERREFVLHFQPQFELASGRMVGVEALLRWQHPSQGLLSPSHFLPTAEESGLIVDIGAWVLAEGCRQMVSWQQAGLDVPRLALNISMQQIERTELVADIRECLRETGMEARLLEIELTETSMMNDPKRAAEVLGDLKALGVSVAIDDFGMGHSSLAYLKRLPLDRLKIDRSFVREVGRDPQDEAICRAVIDLARRLGLETIAEGVEFAGQANFLRGEGCDLVQGYLYARPVPASNLVDYCRTRQNAP